MMGGYLDKGGDQVMKQSAVLARQRNVTIPGLFDQEVDALVAFLKAEGYPEPRIIEVQR